MKPADGNRPRAILVVLDDQGSSSLMHHAVVLARRSGARVVLVHVLAPDPAEKKTPVGFLRIADPSQARTVLERLEYAALQAVWQGIDCESIVLSGDPAEQIGALARARGADRVLVTTRTVPDDYDSGELPIAEHLLDRLDVPLYVLGPFARSYPETGPQDGRILLPLSLRHDRLDYLKFASGLAREMCSRLALLHVVSTAGISLPQRDQLLVKARTHLAALAASESDSLFPIEVLVREGEVVRSIVEEAMCPHRDLIVLGTRIRHGPLAPRSAVAHDVIQAARCPVVTLKPHGVPAAKTDEWNRLARAREG